MLGAPIFQKGKESLGEKIKFLKDIQGRKWQNQD
jgi:hypothetical protein